VRWGTCALHAGHETGRASALEIKEGFSLGARGGSISQMHHFAGVSQQHRHVGRLKSCDMLFYDALMGIHGKYLSQVRRVPLCRSCTDEHPRQIPEQGVQGAAVLLMHQAHHACAIMLAR